MDDTAPTIPRSDHIADPAARQLIDELVGIIDDIRAKMEEMEAENVALRGEMAEMKRALFGQKSERMATIDEELRRKRNNSAKDKAKRKKRGNSKRRKNRDAKKRLPEEQVVHDFPEDEQVCPICGRTKFDDLGEGETSTEYEWVPGHFVRRKHTRKKKACRCGSCILTAPGPVRVSDGVQYGPGFHANVVVSKCSDSLPLYRQEQRLKRVGIPIGRSTLCNLFHRSAELLEPIWKRMQEMLPDCEHINADETSVPVQQPGQTRRAYMWVFAAQKMAVYHYSPDRSGQTPEKVLGNSTGKLQVDGYSGYNHVTTPKRRKRAGCWAHVRRYFYAALETAPKEARYGLDRILDLYQIEYAAAEKEILGNKQHLRMRQSLSADILAKFKAWLEKQKPLHLPKGPMGAAIKYTLNQWPSLTVFLNDPKVGLDNNISERQLRIIALGRKNFLFVGHDAAGANLAILQSLVSTCQLNNVNPQDYLADVLIRIQTHPMVRIDELIPQNWKPPDGQVPQDQEPR